MGMLLWYEEQLRKEREAKLREEKKTEVVAPAATPVEKKETPVKKTRAKK